MEYLENISNIKIPSYHWTESHSWIRIAGNKKIKSATQFNDALDAMEKSTVGGTVCPGNPVLLEEAKKSYTTLSLHVPAQLVRNVPGTILRHLGWSLIVKLRLGITLTNLK